MRDERLRTLIEDADVAVRSPIGSARELADRVRVLHQRKQRVKAAGVAVVLLAGAVALWFGRIDRREGRPDGVRGVEMARDQKRENGDVAAKDDEARRSDRLREIAWEIERAEVVSSQLLAGERGRRLGAMRESTRVGLDERLLADAQVGPAALAVLASADRHAGELDDVAAARNGYLFLKQTFPNTIWASRAEERLAALKP